jgi:hypothetical protein
LEYWPYYAHPEPSELPFSFHYSIAWAFLFPTFWTLFIWPILVVVKQFMRLKEFRCSMLGFALLWLTILILVYYQPVNFLDWFMD